MNALLHISLKEVNCKIFRIKLIFVIFFFHNIFLHLYGMKKMPINYELLIA